MQLFKKAICSLGLVFVSLFSISLGVAAQNHETTSNCTGGGEAWVDGVCRQVRTHSEVNEMFVPKRIKIGSGSTAYYLDPTTQYSNWDKCTSGIGAQDSTCVVPYRYGVAAGLATITASFSRTSPMIGGVGTSPRWTTTNAVSLTVNCSGVATYANANAPLQGNPSGVLLNSNTAGPVTCIFRAMNSDNEPTTRSITANFIPAAPPTIQVGFSRANFDIGTGGARIIWNSTNAKTVYASCTGFNWGPGYVGLQGNPSGVTMDRTSAGTIRCTFTATGDTGLTATATATATVNVAPPPPRPPAPQIVSQFSHNDIMVGNGSLLQIHTANATDVYLRCTGLWPAFGPIPLNQGWQGDWIVYNKPGKTNCSVTAQNAVGDKVTVTPELRVYTTNAEGDSILPCTPSTCTVPTTPTLPPASGVSGGQVTGYTDPNTGIIYRNADGTEPCAGCRSDPTMMINSSGDAPKTETTDTSEETTTSTEDTSTTSPTSPTSNGS